jgi:hypothetical protein
VTFTYRVGDPVTEQSRSTAQTATALLTSMQAGLHINFAEQTITADDGFTDDIENLLDELSAEELRDVIYSLLGMWTVTAHETHIGGLFSFSRSPEERLRTAGLYYASTPTRDQP